MNRIVDIVRAIGEPTRLRLLALLARGEMAAGEMSTVLNQSQPRVSRHLKLLAEAGLIERRPEGAWVFFRLTAEGAAGIIVRSVLGELPEHDFQLSRDIERLLQIRAQREEAARAYFDSAADEWEALRRLHQPEAGVEGALRAAIGSSRFGFHVDLGSGTGRMLELFGDVTQRCEGVDSNRKMLALARAKLDDLGTDHASVRQGDILALPFADHSADLVTIHQVLHYLQDPGQAVMEAGRVLAPGGLLLIADFAPHAFEELRERHAHLRLGFTHEEVSKWCEAAGLSVASIQTVAPDHAERGLAVTIWTARRAANPAQDSAAATARGRKS